MMLMFALLVPPLIWVGLAWFLGVRLYRSIQRRPSSRSVALPAALVAALLFLGLPFWDLLPGLMLYRQAVAEIGGVRVYRTVQVEGYLDRYSGLCALNDCWRYLTQGQPYRYREAELPRPPDGLIEPPTPPHGYYELSVGKAGGRECAMFDESPAGRLLRNKYSSSPRCPVIVRRNEPVSRYEHLIIRQRPFKTWFPLVYVEEEIVRDVQTGDRLAEAYRVHYKSWLATAVGLPGGWHYTSGPDGRPFEIPLRDVLQPIGDTASEIP